MERSIAPTGLLTRTKSTPNDIPLIAPTERILEEVEVKEGEEEDSEELEKDFTNLSEKTENTSPK